MANYKFNFTTNTLVVTKDFFENALQSGSDENQIVAQYRSLFPNMSISLRTHRSTPNSNKGLTYERMERYISAFEDFQPYMEEYLNTRKLAEGKTNPYLEVKSWFLRTFPFYYDLPTAINGKYYINPQSAGNIEKGRTTIHDSVA